MIASSLYLVTNADIIFGVIWNSYNSITGIVLQKCRLSYVNSDISGSAVLYTASGCTVCVGDVGFLCVNVSVCDVGCLSVELVSSFQLLQQLLPRCYRAVILDVGC